MKNFYYSNKTLVLLLISMLLGSTLSAQTFSVGTVAGTGTAGSTNATAISASFNFPSGIAVDANRNIYVADRSNHKIRKISPSGVVTTLAGSGTAGSTEGMGEAASFNSPNCLAVDTDGNVYVADINNNKIRKITPNGLVSTFAGNGAGESTDGTGSGASFNSPRFITIDANNNLYVSDYIGTKIRKITTGGVVTTIAGNGTQATTNGNGTNASFFGPTGLAVDAIGNVFVAEQNGQTIRKIATNGDVTTLAGSGTAGSADATGTAASFNGLYQLSIDENNNLYAADFNNRKIRKITPAGEVSTLAGVGTAGSVDGNTSAATFGQVVGVAVFTSNYILVGDYGNHKIRKIVSCAATSSSTHVTTCKDYIWNGQTYTATGAYAANLINSRGCDSTATLHLTIQQLTSTTDATACGEYMWNNETYTESGTYTATGLMSYQGCDSTATLHLTINTAPYIQALANHASSCNSYFEFTSDADSIVLVNGVAIAKSNAVVNQNSYFLDYNTQEYTSFSFGYEDPVYTTAFIYEHPANEKIIKIEVRKYQDSENCNPCLEESDLWTTIAEPTFNNSNSSVMIRSKYPINLADSLDAFRVTVNGEPNEPDVIGFALNNAYRIDHLTTQEYEIEAINKSTCSNSFTLENENYAEYDTLDATSCTVYEIYDYDTDEYIDISKTGEYDYIDYPEGETAAENSCLKFVHLNFTFTGKSFDTTIASCGAFDLYEAFGTYGYLYNTGVYTFTTALYGKNEEYCDSITTINYIQKTTPDLNTYTIEEENCKRNISFFSDADTVTLNNEGLVSMPYYGNNRVYEVLNIGSKSYTILAIDTTSGCKTEYTWLNKSADYDTITINSCKEYTTRNNVVLTQSGVYTDTLAGDGCDHILTINYSNNTPLAKTIVFEDTVCNGNVFDASVHMSDNATHYALFNTLTDTYETKFMPGNGGNLTLESKNALIENQEYVILAQKKYKGEALELDGSLDYLRFNSIFNQYAKAITVESMVYFNGNNQPWAGQTAYNTDNMQSNSWLWHSGTFFVNDNGSWKAITLPTVNKKGWVHVATVADQTGLYIYYDGALVASDLGSVITTAIVGNSNSSLVLGADSRYTNDGGRNSNNAFDNFAIWNATRTQAQIQSDMTTCFDGTESGLVFFNDFNTKDMSNFYSIAGPVGILANSVSSNITSGVASSCTPVCTATISDTIEASVITIDDNISLSEDLNAIEAAHRTETASYVWMDCEDNNKIVVGEETYALMPEFESSFSVKITEGSCVATTACLDWIVTGVSDNTENQALSIYPNPSQGLITIELSQASHLAITNALGETIYSQDLEAGKQSIDLNTQAEGVYFINLDHTVSKLIISN